MTLQEALDELAAQQDVAAFLLAGGFKATGHGIRTCPVALFITARTGEQGTAGASYGWTEVQNIISFSESVRQFIRDFDSGQFPELLP